MIGQAVDWLERVGSGGVVDKKNLPAGKHRASSQVCHGHDSGPADTLEPSGVRIVAQAQ
jgi:hypothetical protein